jgi:hypothetical protein
VHLVFVFGPISGGNGEPVRALVRIDVATVYHQLVAITQRLCLY